MFGKVFCMDLKRSLSPWRVAGVVLLITFFLLMGEWDDIKRLVVHFARETAVGSVEILATELAFDKFKVIYVFLLSAIYTNCFCREESNHYLRMILSRADVTTYTQSKFIVNTISILLASICSFFLFVVFLSPYMPLIPEGEWDSQYYYKPVMAAHPLLFVLMAAVQFGMIAAACSSIGLLFSTYQSSSFVSIGLPGFVFFLAVSYIPRNNPFCILEMVGMGPTLMPDDENHILLNYAWGMLLPLIVISVCGYFFYRRMKWRVENGFI